MQDSHAIFIFKSLRNPSISLKDVNSAKIIGEKFVYLKFYPYLCINKNKQIKNFII